MKHYASLNPTNRATMWDELKSLQISMPWLLIGGFKLPLFGNERFSSGSASIVFMEMVQHKWLVDMGFTGPRFTWNHGNCDTNFPG